ncbi:MAG: hypothetical protein ACLQBA_19350 [Candidatus Binataceae bacterium]
MTRGALLILLSILFTGCARASVQAIGTSHYPPLARNAEVLVYTDDSQVKEPYEVVGIISYTNPGKYQVLTLGKAIEPLKKKAREIGANGIIIGQSKPVKSGIISTGISVDARAIRINKENL